MLVWSFACLFACLFIWFVLFCFGFLVVCFRFVCFLLFFVVVVVFRFGDALKSDDFWHPLKKHGMLSRAEIITAVTMRLLIFEINERDLYHAVSVAEHCNHCGPLSGFLSVLQHPIGRAPPILPLEFAWQFCGLSPGNSHQYTAMFKSTHL